MEAVEFKHPAAPVNKLKVTSVRIIIPSSMPLQGPC